MTGERETSTLPNASKEFGIRVNEANHLVVLIKSLAAYGESPGAFLPQPFPGVDNEDLEIVYNRFLKMVDIEKEAHRLLTQRIRKNPDGPPVGINEGVAQGHRSYYEMVANIAQGPDIWLSVGDKNLLQCFNETCFFNEAVLEEPSLLTRVEEVSHYALVWCQALSKVITDGYYSTLSYSAICYIHTFATAFKQSIYRAITEMTQNLDENLTAHQEATHLAAIIPSLDGESQTQAQDLLDIMHSELVCKFGNDAPKGFKERFLTTYVHVLMTARLNEADKEMEQFEQ